MFRFSFILSTALVAVFAFAGTANAAPHGMTARESFTARIIAPTAARVNPGYGRVIMRLGTENPLSGNPHQLLVLETLSNGTGGYWLRVALPIRPNGTSGWISSNHARLTANPYRIRVSTGRRHAYIYKNGKLVRDFPVVVGAASTPTPRGQFAIYDKVRVYNVIQPWAMATTGHSNVLDEYGGGDGRFALHGAAGLGAALGTAASHGCIRIGTRDVSWIAAYLPVGTPLQIV